MCPAALPRVEAPTSLRTTTLRGLRPGKSGSNTPRGSKPSSLGQAFRLASRPGAFPEELRSRAPPALKVSSRRESWVAALQSRRSRSGSAYRSSRGRRARPSRSKARTAPAAVGRGCWPSRSWQAPAHSPLDRELLEPGPPGSEWSRPKTTTVTTNTTASPWIHRRIM